MRVVQALHWLRDTLPSERSAILSKLTNVLTDPAHGAAIRQDLLDGFNLLPAWMQDLVRELPGCGPQAESTEVRQSTGAEKLPSSPSRSVKNVEVP